MLKYCRRGFIWIVTPQTHKLELHTKINSTIWKYWEIAVNWTNFASNSVSSVLIVARNPNLQVTITQAWCVSSKHSFGLPLRMNELRTQSDHACLTLYSITWNLRNVPALELFAHAGAFLGQPRPPKNACVGRYVGKKGFDLHLRAWKSPAFLNLWLLLASSMVFLCAL